MGRGGDIQSEPRPSPMSLGSRRCTRFIPRLLELHPNTIKHIESSSEEEMTAQEKKLAELQDQIQSGLTIASGGDPTGQVEPRAALADMKTIYANLTKLSRLDTNNRSTTMSLNEAKVAVDECVDADRRTRPVARQGSHGRPRPQRGRVQERALVDSGCHARRRGAGRPRRLLRDAVDHPAGLRGPQPGAGDGQGRPAATHLSSSSRTRSASSPTRPTPWLTRSRAS